MANACLCRLHREKTHMTKLRQPNSVEDALDEANGAVGVETVAHWIGKSVSTVRAYANPDEELHHLDVRDAVTIDRYLIGAGFAPVFSELLGWCADQARPMEQAT